MCRGRRAGYYSLAVRRTDLIESGTASPKPGKARNFSPRDHSISGSAATRNARSRASPAPTCLLPVSSLLRGGRQEQWMIADALPTDRRHLCRAASATPAPRVLGRSGADRWLGPCLVRGSVHGDIAALSGNRQDPDRGAGNDRGEQTAVRGAGDEPPAGVRAPCASPRPRSAAATKRSGGARLAIVRTTDLARDRLGAVEVDGLKGGSASQQRPLTPGLRLAFRCNIVHK
jgi:hypothetical protein